MIFCYLLFRCFNFAVQAVDIRCIKGLSVAFWMRIRSCDSLLSNAKAALRAPRSFTAAEILVYGGVNEFPPSTHRHPLALELQGSLFPQGSQTHNPRTTGHIGPRITTAPTKYPQSSPRTTRLLRQSILGIQLFLKRNQIHKHRVLFDLRRSGGVFLNKNPVHQCWGGAGYCHNQGCRQVGKTCDRFCNASHLLISSQVIWVDDSKESRRSLGYYWHGYGDQANSHGCHCCNCWIAGFEGWRFGPVS